MSRVCFIVALLAFVAVPSAQAQVPSDGELKAMEAKVKESIRRGIKFLSAKRAPEGGWGHAGVDGLAILAYLRSPDTYDDTDPFIRHPLEGLLKIQADKGNGSVTADGQLDNYVTSIAILAWVDALELKKITDPERLKRVEAAIAKARDYLKGIQADEGEGYDPKDKMYGGVGYGGDMRPDLSNAQLAIEAARKAGLDEKDPFFQKALEFLKRTQNRSESNDQKGWPGNDAGFVYYPGFTYGGEYKKPDGSTGYRSYGSMTYAGIKSYVYCGVKWDDPLVRDALEWIRNNYTVETHPNMGGDGLFYYYHTFAKTMDLYSSHAQTALIKDAGGQQHHWRYDLAKQLLGMQREDGSWKNEKSAKWMEGDPVLATTFAVVALNYCQKLAPKEPAKEPAKEPEKK